jgi:DNA-binding LytR/AlgR family response regulator
MKMYQAAIVEDETQIRNYIKNTLIKSFENQQVHITFDSFSSGEKFLSMFDQHYHFDLIFLDIEMPGMDGISICRRIREVAPDTLVVFISNKEELVFQTFEVQPFRFIRKSEYDKQLPFLVQAIIGQLNAQNSQMIRIHEPSSGDIFSFDVKKVLYVEAQRKNCRIVTTTNELIIQCKLMELEEKLSEFFFIKPHRSYLVNCQYIFYVGKNSLQLTNKEEIPISRGKVEEIKQLFLDYTTR